MNTTPQIPLQRFFRSSQGRHETCFYVQPSGDLDSAAIERLRWMLGGGALGAKQLGPRTKLAGNVHEIGPKGVMIPPVSTNLTRAIQEAGIPVGMVKMSRRLPIIGEDKPDLDPMLEQVYPSPLERFHSDAQPLATHSIPFMMDGRAALEQLNHAMAFGWGADEIDAILVLCEALGRDPTILEMVGVAQATCEHCWHGFFNGMMELDGIAQAQTLFQMIKEPLSLLGRVGRLRCRIAFSDNAAAISIDGKTPMLYTANPGQPSIYIYRGEELLCTLKVETHNHPSSIRPEPGAATGVGGCIRDILAVGRGGVPAGIIVTIYAGRLNIPGYDMPGEEFGTAETWQYSARFASGLSQFTDGKDGATHYGNASGIPTLLYYPASFGLQVSGERREFIKPVVAAGLLGWLAAQHATKSDQEPGMLVVAMGGEAFNVGFNGGAGSSDPTGKSTAGQDEASVQRGNPFEQHGVQEVFAECMAMGPRSPIESAHDQGAGGFSVVGFEIGDIGVKYELRRVKVGDSTMSAVEIFCCEYQERVFVLVKPENVIVLQAICAREGVNLEILGEITGNGKFVVNDEQDGSTPVDLPIEAVKGVSRKKKHADSTVSKNLGPCIIPDIQVAEMLERVFKLVSGGSVRHGLNTMDSWVGGRTVVNQRVGPLQLTVSQFAVLVASYIEHAGHAVAQSSQTNAMLVDEECAARLTLATALGNIAFSPIQGGLEGIFSSVNWCWDVKQPGEAVRMYKAMRALKEGVIALKGATPHCGKDSLSLGVTIDKRRIKSPGVCLITMHGAVSDVRKVVTADIKRPRESKLGWLNLSGGKFRLGGSGIAQTCGTVGNDCPDVDMTLFARAFAAMQELVENGLILAGHNTAESGLMPSLVKMAMAGNCGIDVKIHGEEAALFAHEAGFVIEYYIADESRINDVLRKHDIEACFQSIGITAGNENSAQNRIRIEYGNHGHDCQGENKTFDIPTHTACAWYEATSDRIEQEQLPKGIAEAQATDPYRFVTPKWNIVMAPTVPKECEDALRPKVAIFRASGSNGHPEMAAMCMMAGMMPVNVHVNDLMNGTCDLSEFIGIFFVGGFADGDAGGSAVGWAARMKFNANASKALVEFIARPGTFIHGVCNGCQAGVLLGLVPGDELKQRHPDVCFDMVMGHNASGRFEARQVFLRIERSPSIMYRGMEGSILPSIAAHGEGLFTFASDEALQAIEAAELVAMRYCLPTGELAMGRYPWNPNGSPNDIAALTSSDGGITVAMPHAERLLRPETMPWIPREYEGVHASPWLPSFENLGDHARSVAGLG